MPLSGLAYPELAYIDKREKQRKALQVRLARRQARKFMGVSKPEPIPPVPLGRRQHSWNPLPSSSQSAR